jgi:hypothetical protein
MTIHLINQELFNRIEQIQKEFPLITYEDSTWSSRPNKRGWSDEYHEAFKEVEEILRAHITGFSSFTNFQFSKEKGVRLRFQYNWTADGGGLPFTGVGYLWLTELLNGFNK